MARAVGSVMPSWISPAFQERFFLQEKTKNLNILFGKLKKVETVPNKLIF